MKTRRSILLSKNDEINSEMPMHSVLFPVLNNRIKKNIVPETPDNYSISSINTCTASVLDTPDDNNLGNKNANITINDNNYRSNGKKILASNKSHNDSTIIEVTPDLINKNCSKRLGIISLLDSEYNQNNTQIENCKSNYENITSIINRKSFVGKILPFDLNDEKTLNEKINTPNGSKHKSGLHSMNNVKSPEERPKSLPKFSNTSPMIKSKSKRKSRRSSIFHTVNSTIIFENNNSLDLTDTNSGSDIILRNNLKEAINSLNLSSDNYDTSSKSTKTGDSLSIIPTKSSLSSPIFKNNLETNKNGLHTTNNNSLVINEPNRSPISNYNLRVEGELSPLNEAIFQSQDSLTPTQPASIIILKGVIAYVDVRSGAENRSAPVKEALHLLGADVMDKFTMDVTHVIFREGSMSTYQRCVQRGVHLVSPLWVDACRVKLVRVSESLFPISTDYSKEAKVGITKHRKLRSMQPREFEEDEQRAAARIRKRFPQLNTPGMSPQLLSSTSKLPSHNLNSPVFTVEMLLTPNRENNGSIDDTDASSSEKEYNTPLATRMYNRFFSPNSDLTPFRKNLHMVPISPLVTVVNNTTPTKAVFKSPQPLTIRNRRCSERLLSLRNNLDFSFSEDETDFQKKESRGDSVLQKKITDIESSVVQKTNCENDSASQEKNSANILDIQNKDLCQQDDVMVNSNTVSERTNKRASKGVRKSILRNPLNTDKTSSNISEYLSPNVNNNSSTNVSKSVNWKGTFDGSNKENVETNVTSTHFNIDSSQQFALSSQPSSTFSGLSQPSSTRKRRLHTVDIDISPQELIVPLTPQSPEKYKNCVYDDLHIQGAKTQRNVMKMMKKNDFSDLKILPLPRKVKRTSLESAEDVSPLAKSQSIERKRTPGRFSLIPKKRNSLEEFENSKKRNSFEEFRNSKKENYLEASQNSKHVKERKNQTVAAPKSKRSHVATICVTSFHTSDLKSIYAIIKSLGGFKISKEVDEWTTHVVSGSDRRTMNILLGIAKGCWILDVSWLYESIELLKWAPEEPFELFNFCPGAKNSRLLKTKSPSSKGGLFTNLGRICVLETCSTHINVIKVLLQECGASLCSTVRSSDILIGNEKYDRPGFNGMQVSDRWVFDCLQFWEIKDVREYAIE